MENISRSGVHEVTTITRSGENKISGTFVINLYGNTITNSYVLDGNGNIAKDNSINISYKYDNNNWLIESRSGTPFASFPASDVFITKYEYNSIGQLITLTVLHAAFPSANQVVSDNYPVYYSVRYSYHNLYTKNVSKATYFDSSSNVFSVESYEYDTRPNAEKGFFPSIEADNNVTKITYDPDISQNISYSYQYNDAGYPIKRTSSYNWVRIYSYASCK